MKQGVAKRRRMYLVRHGHVSYFDAEGRPLDPRNVSLSAQGIMQAHSLAVALKDIRFDRILCSDLERAKQTAHILAEASDACIEPESALREIRAGRLREIPLDRLEAELAYAYDRAAEADARFIGGEGFAEFERRVLDVVEKMMREDGWENLLIVSHDAVNRIVLCWAAGQDRSAMASFEQDMCCLNIIDVDIVDGKASRRLIRSVNFTPYDALKTNGTLTVMEQVFHSYRADTK
jgi:probable phosphoglycerate mutase